MLAARAAGRLHRSAGQSGQVALWAVNSEEEYHEASEAPRPD